VVRSGEQHSGSTNVRGRASVVRRMVAAVAVYWVALPVAVLWRPFHLFRAAKEAGATRAAIGFTDQFGLAVTVDQQPIWQAHLTWLGTAAWFVGPPLVLWLVWLAWASRRDRRERANALKVAAGPAELGAGALKNDVASARNAKDRAR
jgi:hypothetical protein